MRSTLSFRSAIASTAVGLFLLLFSWWNSYPVYRHSAGSEIFFAINSAYWVGLALTLPSLLLVTRLSPNRISRATGSVLIFIVSFFLSHFFYFPSGPDPFFRSLSQYYISQGHVNALFQAEYWQPAFFILGRIFEVVTALPSNMYEHLFLLSTGVLIAVSIFLIVDRQGIAHEAALLAFSVLVFNFVVYQFAPQTLALSLVLLMIAIAFALPASKSRWFVELVVFISACFLHAFFAVLYLLYAAFAVGATREGKARKIITLGSIYISILLFFTASFFQNALEFLRGSLFEGLGDYAGIFAASAPATTDLLVQFFSRATVIAMGLVCVWGLVLMVRRREFTLKDLAVSMAGAVYLILGLPLNVLGGRALQLLGVTGGLGGGYFGAMRGKWQAMILVILAVTSVSLQMHSSYNMYLFQDPASVQQVVFISSHFDRDHATVYMEDSLYAILRYHLMSRGLSFTINTEFSKPADRLDSYDYYAITSGLIYNSEHGISPSALPLPQIETKANRIADDGMNWWIVSTG